MGEQELRATTNEKIKILTDRLAKLDRSGVPLDQAVVGKSYEVVRSLVIAEEKRLKARLQITAELFPDVSSAAQNYLSLGRERVNLKDDKEGVERRRQMKEIENFYNQGDKAPVFVIALSDLRALEKISF